jgi:hypothetical protein
MQQNSFVYGALVVMQGIDIFQLEECIGDILVLVELYLARLKQGKGDHTDQGHQQAGESQQYVFYCPGTVSGKCEFSCVQHLDQGLLLK